VAQVAVCSQINTKHINTAWAERTVVAILAFKEEAQDRFTWCIQVLRSPNLFLKNYLSQEAENSVISQRNHPEDVHFFHNADFMITWPQQTLLLGFVVTTG